ncbi:ATPase family gene 2 protein homolog A [Planococcus citri]|uniref:ATPase family gene 2 protein homolog A n=1 Tax=Planococcus citri TaxID=170843 RepID=UPI0031F7B1AF
MASPRAKCISSWKKCDSCNTILAKNDVELHSKSHCPPDSTTDWSYGHIHEKKLFSFLKQFEPQDKNELFFNDVIQISLSSAQLCEFPIGDPVIITAKKNSRSIVKPLWPIEDNLLSSVFLTKQSLRELDCFEGPVEVRKIENVPQPAKHVTLKLIKPEVLTEMQITEITKMLSITFGNRVVFNGQFLIVNFYGLKPKFKIVNILPHQSSKDPMDNLNDDLSNLKIENQEPNKLYKILSNTKWKIQTSLNEDTKKSCCEKYCLSKLGGITNIISDLSNVMLNVLISDYTTGESISCGVLIHGISGTGKTYLARAMINNTKLPVIHVCSWQIISKYFGEAESRIKGLFEEAIEKAPSVVLIDELDSFCPNKSGNDQERRILSVLLSMLDKLNDFKVVVLGITRQLDSIDAALRRPGRFDYEIEIPVPDADARIEILQCLLTSYSHDISKQAITQLGAASHGFVGSDLSLACSLANTKAINSYKCGSGTSNESLCPVMKDEHLTWAFTQIKPSAMREILVEVPNVKWSDIGGEKDLKLKLQQVLEWPTKYRESFERLGITPPKGILLFGPPGCSKTMIAKAVATESKLNFISIKGAELFSKWVGESEKAVREVFRKARTVSPCVIFFDEIDAISGERDTDGGSGSNVQDRVLAQLLTELDGVQPLSNVTIISATNRPDRIDSALLRPGRLDRKLYVSLPDGETRRAILTLQLSKTPVSEDVDVEDLVQKTEGYSGAEVIAVCHEAAMKALQDDLNADVVSKKHFSYALSILKPRTPLSLLKIYDKFLENK